MVDRMIYVVEMETGTYQSTDRDEAREINRANPGSSMYMIDPNQEDM